ncbi:hypothetical protein NFI96_007015 [Prochilodus magdalenae]|nr:hypothetical protein NFI96_007015 [Prochilodus magdalenae]
MPPEERTPQGIKDSPQERKEIKKDILIIRGIKLKAAVCAHFPCHLLEQDEEITIQYIQKQHEDTHNTEPQRGQTGDLVTFNIQTQGGPNITKTIMKNKNILTRVSDVCVYAYKGETVRKALERDGRFTDVALNKSCLRDVSKPYNLEMSSLVDDIDQGHFQVIKSDADITPDSQKSSTDSGTPKNTPVKSEDLGSNDISEASTSKKIQEQAQRSSRSQKGACSLTAKDMIKTAREKLNISIPETEEEQDYLEKLVEEGLRSVRSQFKKVYEHLKKQEDIWEVFRVEYGESAQSCNEVHTVKTLMTFADSVCKIRINTTDVGTGFILFHIEAPNPQSSTPPKPKQSFILTNAHVIMTAVIWPSCKELLDNITLIAEFEEWQNGERKLYSRHVKKELVAFALRPADHLDFALLELEDSKEWELPDGLLTKYRPSPPRGGICIIGHPDGGVKKMDPSFLVEPQNQFKNVMRHIIKNKDLKPFMQKKYLKENWTFDSSRITHNSCFFWGSSGSPVFDSFCNLIGIHSGGYAYDGHGGETKSIIEYAYPLLPAFICIIQQSAERGRRDVSEYIQSQLNIMEAIKQEGQSKTLIPGLDNKTFSEIFDGKPKDI